MTKIAWRFRHTEYNCLVWVFKSWCLALMSVYSIPAVIVCAKFEFYWSFWLEENMLNNIICAKTTFCCLYQTLLQPDT